MDQGGSKQIESNYGRVSIGFVFHAFVFCFAKGKFCKWGSKKQVPYFSHISLKKREKTKHNADFGCLWQISLKNAVGGGEHYAMQVFKYIKLPI